MEGGSHDYFAQRALQHPNCALTSWLKVVTEWRTTCKKAREKEKRERHSQKSYKIKTMDEAVAYDVTCFR